MLAADKVLVTVGRKGNEYFRRRGTPIRKDFPGFYAAGLGGFPIRRLVIPGQGPAPVTEYVCTAR